MLLGQADHFHFAFLSPYRDTGESKVVGGAASEMAFGSKKVTGVNETNRCNL
jgi:hypothetical protein